MKIKNIVFGICLCLIVMTSSLFGFTAFADDIPKLKSISFENAELQGEFDPDNYVYKITLIDSSVTPTPAGFEVEGEADAFVRYEADATNRQTGMALELKYANGSVIYTFEYANLAPLRESSDNTLTDIYCNYCQLEPEMNSSDTSYKLYIPCDLTHMIITPVTSDINAYCPSVELTLNETQEPKIPIVCTATDGSQREYTLKLKRVDKSIAEIEADEANGIEVSLSDAEKFYQQPIFAFLCLAVLAGALLILILLKATKRVIARAYDENEKPFYKTIG